MVLIMLILSWLNISERNTEMTGDQLLLNTYTKRIEAMIKKLLNNFLRSFTFDHDREKIEQYLAQSTNTYDLEQRMRELDQKGKYNQFYI